MKLFITAALSFLTFCAQAQSGADALGKTTVDFQAEDPKAVLDLVLEDLKSVFEKVQIRLDSSTQVISPLQIGGTTDEPRLQITLKKCVFIVCETVRLDALLTAHEVSGACERNIQIQADLSRSSTVLTDYYRDLEFLACFNSNEETGKIELQGSAIHSENYRSDMVQKQIFGILKLQVDPIAKALKETLVEKASQN